MSNTLKRLADEVRSLVSTEFLLEVDCDNRKLPDYEQDLPFEIHLDDLDAALSEFKDQDLTSKDDGHMAIAIRSALDLTPQQAADRNMWWWLSVVRYPELVRRRFADIKKDTIDANRMIGMKRHRNAFARLWWGGQMVHELDPWEAYVRMLFSNQDVFEALIGRDLGKYPRALRIILGVVEGKPGLQARLAIRDLQMLLSTMVLEGMTDEAIETDLRRLYELQAASD
jgi:Family of unknown function (DUF6339)